jgi:hypothetical protein
MNRNRFAALTIATMILLALPAYGQTDTPVGKAAPEFDLPTLSGSQNLALEDLRGKIVVLHFGAGW